MAENCNGESDVSTAIKPNLSHDEAVDLVQRLYKFQDVVCLEGFISYDNQNLLIEARRTDSEPESPSEKFVLKLTNSEDSKMFAVHQQFNEILLMVRGCGIQCCWPIKNASGKDITLEKLSFTHTDTGEVVTGEFLTRIMHFLPGQPIGRVPLATGKMCYEAGQMLGIISIALQGYSGDTSQFVERDNGFIWSLNNLPKLREYVHVLQDESQKTIIGEILDAFDEKVISERHKFTKGLIHGDYNDYNILIRNEDSLQTTSISNGDLSVSPREEKDVVGILDFDDMAYSFIVYDIAIAIMYIMQCKNLEKGSLESGGILLAGFLSKHILTDDEWKALYYCVVGRFAQSLVLGLYTHMQQPQNDYLLSTQVKGWTILFDLWGRDVQDVYVYWKKLINQYNQ